MDLFSGGLGSLSGLASTTKGLFDIFSGMSDSYSAMNWMKLQNELNIKMNEENNTLQQDLVNKMNAFNRKQWEDTNLYNRPSSQVARFMEAGMSKAAAVQASQGFASSPVQQATIANTQPSQVDYSGMIGHHPLQGLSGLVDGMLGTIHSLMDLRKKKVDVEKAEKTKDSDISGIISENDAKQWSLYRIQQDYDYYKKSYKYNLRSMNYKLQVDKQMPEYQRLANEEIKLKVGIARKEFGWLDKFNRIKFDNLQQDLLNKKKEWDKMQQDIHESQSREGLNYASIENVNQDTKNKVEENKGIKLRNFGQVLDNTLTKHGTPQTWAGRVAAMYSDGLIKDNQVVPFMRTMKTYINTGGKVFNGDDEERQFFNYFINPGVGQSNSQPLWNKGTIRDIRDDNGRNKRKWYHEDTNIPHIGRVIDLFR